ncbi:MAG: HRDC domain-containing protein [Actinobacteria bacterium]|nr:HRDC domain-containing protein [Actinomycetota bacterium]
MPSSPQPPGAGGEEASAPARVIDDDDGLAEVVAALADAPAYAVDTEFHRERSYYPRLALVQIAWAGGTVLVDPLAVDITPLRRVLEGPGLAVMHAASQDLEVLERGCGAVPSRLFDTQLAAGFLGFSTPSLASLASRILGVDLPKASRLTDWMRRPLDLEQQRYAAADVDHLLELAELLRAELEACGRLAWAEAECEELRTRRWGPPAPEDAWLRLKESRSLRGRTRGIVHSLAAWRERRAAATDQPVRFVLSDLALVGIAGEVPKDLDQLHRIRGVDQRHTRGAQGREILTAVEAGRSVPESALVQPRRDDLDRELRPALALLVAWVSQLSRELAIDPALLATRNDLTAFLNDDPEARLAKGWREQLVGRPARRLVRGELALAFDGKGGLTLERRSGDLVGFDVPRPRAPWTSEG